MKNTNTHDEQTSATAESLRAILNDANFRGGMTERDTEALKARLEGIAKGLDEQGKTPEELKAMREESNEPDPTKAPAELVRESFNAEDPANDKKNVSSPGPQTKAPQPKEDLGKPLVTSQASTKDRDAVETAAKKGEQAVKDASKK